MFLLDVLLPSGTHRVLNLNLNLNPNPRTYKAQVLQTCNSVVLCLNLFSGFLFLWVYFCGHYLWWAVAASLALESL